MKNKERYIWISLVAILSCSLFQPIERVKAISTDGEKYLQILHEVVAFIETDYVWVKMSLGICRKKLAVVLVA